eukprot:TRINITY_DN150_c0_g3_i2.p1 TRINITY_DN150_c0_g3~~TRINITY_DN150_c0_g3_i2.p1  ORF type:complete len:311 (-),score=56.42 TRINITY_DN150_c0_g3_i2:63-995(-)
MKVPDPVISLDLESELNALTADLQAPLARESVMVKKPIAHEPMHFNLSTPKRHESDDLDALQAELNSFSDETSSPKRRTQILEAHGQKKNPLLDNMLKDLTSASKTFEKPAEAIPINPKIGASPKATINKVKKEVPPSEPPKQVPVHPANVPKFTPTKTADTSSSTLFGVRARRPGYCPTCGLNLKAKPGAGVMNAMGSEWHKECFSCNFCKKTFTAKDKFMLFKEEVYHHQCVVQMSKLKSNTKAASPTPQPRCKACGQLLGIGDIVFLGDRSTLHKACFRCVSCNAQLRTDSVFTNESGGMICPNCAQ